MKPILEIKNISKKFRIYHQHQHYLSIRDSIVSSFKKKTKGGDEDFWALKNVSFEVQQGESIGIIGKNGAGKSTLLKILSKITPPTSGKIISRGRIASLLEVGTGFHGELSGRENIYLNGSILGMRRKEIESKFDEIIDFSGVEKFIDTPLKHYSSGMQLRLAFAVAAFLEPEILIIDEVLAVGDTEFQKKCLRKMDEITKGGRTIVFVSHNTLVLKTLCTRGVLLIDGSVKQDSKIDIVVNEYLSTDRKKSVTHFSPQIPIEGKGVNLQEAYIEFEGKEIDNSKRLNIVFKIQLLKKTDFSATLFVFREEELAFLSADYHDPLCKDIMEPGTYSFQFTVPPYLLNPGFHRVGLVIADFKGNTTQYLNRMDILNFEVQDDGFRRGNKYEFGWGGASSPLLNIKWRQ